MTDILKKIIPFFKLIRYPNLAIIIFTQLLTYYFITDWYLIHSLFPKGILLLIGGSVLIAAAGYIINDLFDIDIDSINKPEKVLINRIFSKNFVIITYSLLNIIALLCGLMMGIQIFFIFIFTIILLLLYSVYFKKQLILGNLIVSVMLALTVFIVWIYCPFGDFGMLLFYTAFAFMSSFIREIVKDMEDIEGDKKLKCLTLPIVAGVKAARNTVLILIILLIWLIEFSTVYLHFNSVENSFKTAIFLNIFSVIPLIMISWNLLKATERKEFSSISRFMKLIMLAGILSMILL